MNKERIEALKAAVDRNGGCMLSNEDFKHLCDTAISAMRQLEALEREPPSVTAREALAVLNEVRKVAGANANENTVDAVKRLAEESEGLWRWKCRVREALGVDKGTDCAAEIRRLKQSPTDPFLAGQARAWTRVWFGLVAHGFECRDDENAIDCILRTFRDLRRELIGKSKFADNVLGTYRHASGCPDDVNLYDWIRAMREGIDETREILGVGKAGIGKPTMAEAAKHIVDQRDSLTTDHPVIQVVEAIRQAARCPKERNIVEYVQEMRDGIMATREVLRAASDEPMVNAARFHVERSNAWDRVERGQRCGDETAVTMAAINICNDALGGIPARLQGLTGWKFVNELAKHIKVELARNSNPTWQTKELGAMLLEAQTALDSISKRFEAERKALDEQKQINAIAHAELSKAKAMLVSQDKFLHEIAGAYEKAIDEACGEIARLKSLLRAKLVVGVDTANGTDWTTTFVVDRDTGHITVLDMRASAH